MVTCQGYTVTEFKKSAMTQILEPGDLDLSLIKENARNRLLNLIDNAVFYSNLLCVNNCRDPHRKLLL